MSQTGPARIEHDLLGDLAVPADVRTGRGILELVREKDLPSAAQIDAVLDPLAMTGRRQFI